MKFQKEKFILFINILISFFLGALIWDYIKFEFHDPQIIGIYSENQYNSLNDIVRYIVFISLPILFYIVTKLYFKVDLLIGLKDFFSDEKLPYSKRNKYSYFFFSLLLVFLILDFLSLTFPEYSLDSYHDGQKLSSAYKSFLDGSLWSGSYVTVGIFYETLSSKFIWLLFDNVSIGLSRYALIFYIFIFKILLLILIFQITNYLNLDDFYKNIFFIFNATFLNQLCDYNTASVDLISYREIPIILTSIFFLILLKSKNNNFILFLISILSVGSMLWGIDRGLVCNLLIITILIYLLSTKNYKKFYLLIFYLLLNWIIFISLANDEFMYFYDNTITIFKEMNYIHGLIHPTPFTDDPNSARASKTLISISISILISLDLIFNKKKHYSSHLKKIFLFLSIISVLSYLYALGRSDGPHIKNSFGYPITFLFIYISYSFLLAIYKKNIKYSKITLSLFALIIVAIYSEINFKKIISYESRFTEYVNLKDEFFLSKKEKILVDKINPITSKYECIQLLSNDAALYYLLRKKSCTKYYFVWSASSSNIQKKFKKELSNTKLILEGGEKNNWDLPLKSKLPIIYKHVVDNFLEQKIDKNWRLFLREK